MEAMLIGSLLPHLWQLAYHHKWSSISLDACIQSMNLLESCTALSFAPSTLRVFMVPRVK